MTDPTDLTQSPLELHTARKEQGEAPPGEAALAAGLTGSLWEPRVRTEANP
jgi:hypothetical protein